MGGTLEPAVSLAGIGDVGAVPALGLQGSWAEAHGTGRAQQGCRANPQILPGFCHGSRHSFLVKLINTWKLLMWQRRGEEENILSSLFKSTVIKGFLFFT